MSTPKGKNNLPKNAQENFSGQYLEIDMNATFFNGEQVEGIELVTNFEQVRELHVRLGEYAKGPKNFFPAMWPVKLSKEKLKLLETEKHFVIPKPTGTRYLLYVDPSGQMFLENMTQNVFRIDGDHLIDLISSDGQSITDTVLDGVVTRVSEAHPDAGRLTFVIMDATLCRGVQLTQVNISQRIAYVRDEIMAPRLRNQTIKNDKEAFNLDIVECKESYEAPEAFMSEKFRDELFRYPLLSIIFVPRNKNYTCGTCFDVFQWTNENDVCRGVFRLRIPKGRIQTKVAELHVVGPYRKEINFASIALTDELRELDGRIIDCHYIENQWNFKYVRNDREHPNGRIAVESNLKVFENPVKRSQLLTSLDIAKRSLASSY